MDLKTAEQAGAIAIIIDNLTAFRDGIQAAFDSGLLFREVTLETGPTFVLTNIGMSAGATKQIFGAFVTALNGDIDTYMAQLAALS